MARTDSGLIVPGDESPDGIVRTTIRRTQGTREENGPLRGLAEKFQPVASHYLGSFATHIYFRMLSRDPIYATQFTGFDEIHELVANDAIKHTARQMMQLYGHRPPQKRGDKSDEVGGA